MTHYYVSQYTGTGTPTDKFRAVVADGGGDISTLDLRPDPMTATGWCIATTSVRNDHPGAIWLGEDILDTAMTTQHRNWVNANLGVVLDTGTTYRDAFFLILQAGDDPYTDVRSKWRSLLPVLDRWQLVLANETIIDLPVVGGGAVATDDFNRANGGLGANWTNRLEGNTGGTFAIDTNEVKDGNTWSWATYNAAANASADHYSSITIGTAAYPNLVAAARMPSDHNTGYQFTWDGSQWEISTCVNGGYSNVAYQAGTAPVSGDVLRIEVNGSSIIGKQNGTQRISVTNTVITVGNYAGFASDNNTQGRITYWETGALGAASTGICRLCRSHY